MAINRQGLPNPGQHQTLRQLVTLTLQPVMLTSLKWQQYHSSVMFLQINDIQTTKQIISHAIWYNRKPNCSWMPPGNVNVTHSMTVNFPQMKVISQGTPPIKIHFNSAVSRLNVALSYNILQKNDCELGDMLNESCSMGVCNLLSLTLPLLILQLHLSVRIRMICFVK